MKGDRVCGVRWDGVCGVRVWREECEVGSSVWCEVGWSVWCEGMEGGV